MNRHGLRAAVFALALFAITCGGSGKLGLPDPSAVRVTASFDAGWTLSQLSLRAGDREATVPEKPTPLSSGEQVVLLLDDDAAGKAFPLEIWGLSEGQRVARGEATATPILHATVDVAVALSHLPCGVGCAEGATACANDGVTTCELAADGCTRWSVPSPKGWLRELEAEPLLLAGGVAGGRDGAWCAPDAELVEQPFGLGRIGDGGHHAHAALAARAPERIESKGPLHQGGPVCVQRRLAHVELEPAAPGKDGRVRLQRPDLLRPRRRRRGPRGAPARAVMPQPGVVASIRGQHGAVSS